MDSDCSSSQEDLNSEDFDCSADNSSDRDTTTISDETERLHSEENGSSTEQPKPSSLCQNKEPKLNRQEQMEFYRLASHIAQLNDSLKEKEEQLKLTGEELKKCRESIEEHKVSCHQIETAIDSSLNNVSNGLMKLQLEKLQKELLLKRRNEEELKEKISQQELELLEAQLLCSQYESIQPLHQEQETLLQQHKHKQALFRVQAQTREVIEAQRRDMKRERDLAKSSIKAAKLSSTDTVEESTFHQYLQEKQAKLKAQETIEEEKRQAYTEKRIKALLSLKKNIESNRDSLRAHQLLVKEKEKRLQKEERDERARILDEGGDPDVSVMKRKQMEQLEKEKQKFEEKQKRRKMEIVAKLLEESKRLEKTKKRQSKQLQTTLDKKHRKAASTKSDKERQPVSSELPNEDAATAVEGVDVHEEEGVPATTDDEERNDTVYIGEKSLLQPDIPGLWEPAAVRQIKTSKMSKMEQSIMDKTLTKLKESAVETQIAAGKEFKGQQSFLSKPEEIIFKDFDVGKMYKKRLQLTNISYTINHIKLLGVSDNLMDFLQIEFNPPGAMSAGLTCPLVATFEPKLNEDLVGTVDFLSQTGPFSINVKCLIKKCVVIVDAPEVRFGSVCIGETVKRSFTVHNKGALSTEFVLQSFVPSQPPDMKSLAEESTVHSNAQQSSGVASQKSILSTVEYATNDKLLSLGDGEKHSHSMVNIGSLSTAKVQFEEEVNTAETDTAAPSDKEETETDKSPEEKPTKKKKGDQSNSAKKGEGSDKKNRKTNKTKEKGKLKDSSTKSVSKEEQESSTKPSTDDEVTVTRAVSIESIEKAAEGETATEVAPPVEEKVVTEEEAVPETTTLAEDIPTAITVGEVSAGELCPYSSRVLELTFAPMLAGDYQCHFTLVAANNSSPEPIYITATGQAIDVPIYTDKQTIDLKICMIDRLYQDSIILHNRSRLPLQATFCVPSVLSNHMEIVPKHGLVQAESSFSAQLKFLPLLSLLTEEGVNQYIENSILNVPVNIQVAGQTSPVTFAVSAAVTESDIALSQTVLEFGNCTIHESVVTSIELTNRSCLPQNFGFIHLPKWLSVQPNDGFGTLLPHETLSVDVIFTPDKPQLYSCTDVYCLTGINKQYKLSVSGTGVQPALKLSHSSILFATTPVNVTSVTRINISNPSLSRASSAVIRGMAPMKGSRLFEFCIPEGLPISVSPTVGIIKPGQSLSIEVAFSPRLDSQSIHDTCVKLATAAVAEAAAKRAEEEKREAAAREEEKAATRKSSKGRRGVSQASNKSSLAADSTASSTITSNQKQQEPDTVAINEMVQSACNDKSSMWWEANSLLLAEYQSHQYRTLIPCFISTALINGQHTTDYRREETLYLDITAAAIRPSLIVVSDDGRTTVDFGTVGIGSSQRKSVVLKNISSEILKLSASQTREGFELRNALRDILPDSSHRLLLQFCPLTCGKYYEMLHLRYGPSSYLELTLLGCGVDPIVHVTPRDSPVDWGHVMAGDTAIQTVQLENTSEITVEYNMKTDRIESGSANCNGQPVFTCIPFTGHILPGTSADINIHFSPDRADCQFSESLIVEINGKQIVSLELRGHSCVSNMYALGGERVGSDQISMAATTVSNTADTDTHSPHPLLFIFKHTPSTDSDIKSTHTQQLLQIGCIKTALVKKPKSEYVIEQLQGTDAKCFTIDPMKNSLEAGESKDISITFNPPADPNKVQFEAQTNVILKGDTSIQYQLFLRGIVCNSS